MKGEKVRGTWARRGWDPVGVLVAKGMVRFQIFQMRAYCYCTCSLLVAKSHNVRRRHNAHKGWPIDSSIT